MDTGRAVLYNGAIGSRFRLWPIGTFHLSERSNAVAYIITDACTMCGTCESACPVEAIKPGDPKYVIDADECVDCGACVGECPVEAIKEVE